ncbi:MAG: glycoside hydrolase family 32 protein, partial [Clostridia bacterium]
MNTQTKEPRNFRPQYHYTPQQGWINDPNGLVYRDGTYHLFAQHCPDRNIWGPMHWIHATSQDLLTWKPEGVPLAPDEELGMIFSGSAIVDFGNTSGLAQNGNPMIAMFTHHGTCEQQSMAYSTDDIHFTKYAGNPIIPTKGQKDFRDPKVFENEIKHCKTAVIAAGDHVEFYASADFKAWRKTGEFGRKENTQQWIFECPDLFPLTTIDGITRWVLTASMIFPKETGGSRTLYYLGEFDGETFRCTEQYEQRLMVDEGYDNYAAVTFNGTKECIQLGWATSWTYANELPTQGYRGQMTCARKLSLCTTPAGLRLAAAP